MKATFIIGIALLVLGAAVIVYQQFSYTTTETVLQVGPVTATAERSHDVALPLSRLDTDRRRGCRARLCRAVEEELKQPGTAMHDRPQSATEEIANSLSHGLGLLLALAAAPVLIVASARQGNTANIVGACVFAVTMVMLYLSSAIYHAAPPSPTKHRLAKLDHIAIYLFIAGSYTPFALGVLNGPWGWTLFGLVWGLAALGLALKLFDKLSHPLLSTGLYLAMGWLVVIAAVPLLERAPPAGVAWLLAGGLAYTAGVVFFLTDARIRFGHFVWHLFVLAGTTCHFFAVLWYSA